MSSRSRRSVWPTIPANASSEASFSVANAVYEADNGSYEASKYNKCQKDLVYYFSREAISNFERKFSTQYDAKIIMQELADLTGVAAIKGSSKLSGNEFMGFPLDANSVRPMVGMGVNTIAMPRPVYNSNYEFVVWGAIGFEVRTDFAGNTCAFFASDLG